MTDPSNDSLELQFRSNPATSSLRSNKLDSKTAAQADAGIGNCLHERFERQVERTPDAVAVSFEGDSLTYAQLNTRANQLAHYLMARGVGPETLVGIYLKRSPTLLVALLAVLKAGGAYVPLDPIYPAERVTLVLADAGVAILLTESDLVSALGTVVPELVCLDRDESDIARARPDNPVGQTNAAYLAYVIYTSGSTGGPKGVQIEHRALVNLLRSMQHEPGLGAEDVLLAVTTISFDIAGLEMFLPLIVGARLVLAPWHVTADGVELIRQIERHRVTVMQATPATWRLLLDVGWKGAPGLKILCGGEPLPRDLAADLIPRCSELWNMYGPTETTIWSTCGRIRDPDDRTIGRPIANTTVHIFDENHQPVPGDIPGELLIGGDGLARGYLQRSALTAEKFIADPANPSARLYRTGDLARLRSDGKLECLGRLDFQIKIRGFRIEPEEIESVLVQHSSVRQAIVIAREDAPGDRRLVAYVVANEGSDPSQAELRTLLRSKVPDYMVPAAFVILEKLPLTPNGKIDRKALPRPEENPAGLPRPSASPRTPLEESITAIWQEVLGIEQVGLRDNFFDLGGHSLKLGRVHARLRALLRHDLSIVDLYQYPTISSLAAHLAPGGGKPRGRPQRTPTRPDDAVASDSIAIIGMAGRFPGAGNLEQFWKNLRAGVESVSIFAEEELRAAGVSEQLIRNPDYVPAKSIIDGAECFDSHFFGYSPREAAGMDPQQRVFLEAAWSALEDAGYDPEQSEAVIGVYAGASPNLHLLRVLARHGGPETGYGFPQTIQHEKDYLATRVSYELNLKGPSVSVLTACSTSLVAVHMACRSLRGGECDIALAGAVSVQVPQQSGYLHHPGGIGSRDGHCRVFDADATGTVFGNGVGVVVLKRLSRAWEDGDTIRAVVKGTAINNDGSGKVGFTAPSVDGQASVIAMAHQEAEVGGDDIGYVEAHGTGTVVGDPIEIAALSQAFRATTRRRGFCALGSVKSNIGHLDAAAGMAGLIKTVLALEHREIPPSINFRTPNPQIDFAASPFTVNTSLTEWKAEGPRRAGVSSFGVGGTNAHVILEEAAVKPSSAASRKHHLLLLSARTAAALDRVVGNLHQELAGRADMNLADAAYTLQVGRQSMEHRRMLVCANRDEALSGFISGRLASGRGDQATSKIVFMFSGQGSQYVGMGGEFYREEPRFAQVVDECLEHLRGHLEIDLRPLLLDGADGRSLPDINQTALAQPALFVVEYALARLWMSWGIAPQALVGHSIGEYVAACLAGTMSLTDALRVVALRGRLMQGLPAGAMLAVPLAPRDTESRLDHDEWRGRISLAAANAPTLSVVSGPVELLAALEASLAAEGIVTRKLQTSHAFHSAMMDPIVAEFTTAMVGIDLHPPRIPCLSNVTGSWLSDADACDPSYYARHLRNAVRFSENIQTVAREFSPLFLEVGPGQTLTSLVRKHRFGDRPPKVYPSMSGPKDRPGETRTMIDSLGHLWLEGIHVDGRGFHLGRPRRRMALPTYPFEQIPHGLDAVPKGTRSESSSSSPQRAKLDAWFYLPGWKSSLPARVASESRPMARRKCLVLRRGDVLHEDIVQRMMQEGAEVVQVQPAKNFSSLESGVFGLNPGDRDDYVRLLRELQGTGRMPDLIVDLWPLGRTGPDDGRAPNGDDALHGDLFVPLFLAQALAAVESGPAVDIKVVMDGSVEVDGEGVPHPEKALAMGPCIVAPQEFANLACSCIDVLVPGDDAVRERRLLDQLIEEFSARSSEAIVAYRDRKRWTRTYESCPLPTSESRPPLLREDGVYLITGGLGGVGLELAEYLARVARARLVLTGRSAFPNRSTWSDWLADHGPDDQTSETILRLQAIEGRGAKVLVGRADVADAATMRDVVARTREQFGRIDGVIHAAGIAGGGAIPLKTRETAAAVLRAKVVGTRVLAEVCKDQPPEFMLLCSSVNAIGGGFGQVDYCAANAFLDAFAIGHERRTSVRTLSVNWDSWAEVGMAANTTVPEHLREQRAATLRDAITPREGQEAFARVLAAGFPQIVVSTRDFNAMRGQRRSAASDGDGSTSPAETSAEVSALGARPELRTTFAAPQSNVEVRIAGIWQRCLGIERVGRHDNFFELGGDSLLAVSVTEQIRRELNTTIPIVSFYDAPTVALLAQRLDVGTREPDATVAAPGRRNVNRVLAQRARRRQDPVPFPPPQSNQLDP